MAFAEALLKSSALLAAPTPHAPTSADHASRMGRMKNLRVRFYHKLPRYVTEVAKIRHIEALDHDHCIVGIRGYRMVPWLLARTCYMQTGRDFFAIRRVMCSNPPSKQKGSVMLSAERKKRGESDLRFILSNSSAFPQAAQSALHILKQIARMVAAGTKAAKVKK